MSDSVTAVDPRIIGWKWYNTADKYEEKRLVIVQNVEHIIAFREFCVNSANCPQEWHDEIGEKPFEEYDFYALSLGFFIARGVDWPTAFELATLTRYSFQYWC